jgi:hypothetical protein
MKKETKNHSSVIIIHLDFKILKINTFQSLTSNLISFLSECRDKRKRYTEYAGFENMGITLVLSDAPPPTITSSAVTRNLLVFGCNAIFLHFHFPKKKFKPIKKQLSMPDSQSVLQNRHFN